MLKFTQIELFLDNTYSLSEQKIFILKSRSICNYIERYIVKHDIKAAFKRLNIHCTRDASMIGVTPLKFEPFLEAREYFDLPTISDLSIGSLQAKFLEIIIAGLKSANIYSSVDESFFDELFADIAVNNFINKWVHKDKYWKRWDCRCVIEAELTVDEFLINQYVYLKGKLVTKFCIATSMPREAIFSEYLGDLTISSEGILYYRNKTKVLSEYNLQKVSNKASQKVSSKKGARVN